MPAIEFRCPSNTGTGFHSTSLSGHDLGPLHQVSLVLWEIAHRIEPELGFFEGVLVELQLFANGHLGHDDGPVRAFDALATLQRHARGDRHALNRAALRVVRVKLGHRAEIGLRTSASATGLSRTGSRWVSRFLFEPVLFFLGEFGRFGRPL